jgi:sugar phosphate isomerase/epimerase
MKIGFSTSSFYKIPDFDTKQAIALYCELGCKVIELSASEPNRVEWLKRIKRPDVAGFSFISLHTPNNDRMAALERGQKEELLSFFADTSKRLKIDCVLFHPGEWLGDYSILKNYNFQATIENMDCRNKIGTTVESMKELLAKGNFKMTLDLNHCYTNDKTMKLAHDFYNVFANKISHFHLSDFNEHLPEGEPAHWHNSFFKCRHNIILENIPGSDKPIILEESLLNEEEAKIELKYLKKFFN